jgi:molecular chaperone GrpE
VAGSNRDEKGSFQTDISQDLIDAALKSVERHKRREEDPEPSELAETAGEEAAADEAVMAGDSEPGETELELESSMDTPSVDTSELEAHLGQTRQELAQARQELEDARAQLEFSQSKGREMMERLKESHERAVRATADLENYRKRAQKEKEEVQRYGVERLLKDLLPVVDNLDRALGAAKQSPDFDSFRTGVSMTRKLFEDTLGRHGVKGFSAAGQVFDPRLHEAMQQVETAEVPAGHVAHEVLRGYMLNDRLVRPALVAVARAPVAVPVPAASAARPATVPPAGPEAPAATPSAQPGNPPTGSQ